MKQTLYLQCYAHVTVFHLAVCAECGGPKVAQPFTMADDRDTWLRDHATATGHHVSEATEVRMVTP